MATIRAKHNATHCAKFDVELAKMDDGRTNFIDLFCLQDLLYTSVPKAETDEQGADFTVIFNNGNTYQGEMSDGFLHGRGKFTWAETGVTYVGEFVRNSPTGFGTLKWPNGSIYEGDFVDGKRHGKGTYQDASGIRYTGEWKHGIPDGQGRIDYDSEGDSFYDGELKNGLRHGTGIYKYPDPDHIYEGEWVEGKKCGFGTMCWGDEVYSGLWLDGIPHGQGSYAWQFKRTKQGQYLMPNIYDGNWEHGKRSGLGTFHYPNGAKYVGYWKDNRKDGRGAILLEDGRMLEHVFEKDQIIDRSQGDEEMGENLATRLPIDPELPIGFHNYQMTQDTSGYRLIPTHINPHLPGDEAKKSSEFVQMQNCIKSNLDDLCRIYRHYSRLGTGELPDNTAIMRYFQLCQLLKDGGVHRTLDLSTVDRLITDTFNAGSTQKHDRLITFNHFVNILAILACQSLKKREKSWMLRDPCTAKTTPTEELKRVLVDQLIPQSGKSTNLPFGNVRYDTEIVTYLEQMWNIYQFIVKVRNPVGTSAKTISMRDFILLFEDLKLYNKNMPVGKVIEILCWCNPVLGHHYECDLNPRMSFFDFLEALVHCAQLNSDEVGDEHKEEVTPTEEEQHVEEPVHKAHKQKRKRVHSGSRKIRHRHKAEHHDATRSHEKSKEQSKEEVTKDTLPLITETEEPEESQHTEHNEADEKEERMVKDVAERVHHFFKERFIPAINQYRELYERVTGNTDAPSERYSQMFQTYTIL